MKKKILFDFKGVKVIADNQYDLVSYLNKTRKFQSVSIINNDIIEIQQIANSNIELVGLEWINYI
jgi:hypothetical protein